MSKKQKYQGSNPKQVAAPNPVPVSGLLGKLFATKEQALPSAGITPPIWQESEVTALINQLPVEARTQFAALIEQFAQMGSQLKAAISQNEESQRSAQTTKNDYEAQLAQLEPRKTELQRQQLALESQTAVLNDREQALATREVASTTRERELIEREIAIRSGLFEEQQRALTTLREQVAVLEAQRVQLPLTIEEDRQRLLAQTKVLINELLEQVKKRDEEIGQREVALVTRSIGLDRREDRLRVGGSQLVNAQEATKQAIREEFEIELQEQRQRAQRLERQNVRLSDKLDSQQAELDEFQDIRDQLGNNPERLLEQLEKLKKDNRTLDLRVQDLQASRSEEDVTLMRSQRDSLQERLSAAEEALFDLRRRESEWRMGVTEREDWQRQRVVLQKHRDLLAEAVQRLQSDVEGLVNKQQGLTPFPELTRMDLEMTTPCVTQRPPNLKDLVVDLQTRIAFAEPGKELHFRTEDLQLFVGGLAMSQLHIFQGISGTGKTSLATAFAKAVGGVCTTISVQAGWRDRADLLGHYNTFEKRYYEGEALQALYRAQTDADRERIHVVLLDEMNLSRPEQYFANFLSTLELGEAERWISLMESRPAHGAPVKLRDGRFIQVPPNLWFIGTANHDETTSAFADKTHDRSFVLDLPKHEPSGAQQKRPGDHVTWQYSALRRQFNEASRHFQNDVRELLAVINGSELTDLLQNDFNQGWGNRLERQMAQFLPVVVATGGSRGLAVDHLLCSRMFREGKVVGRHDVQPDNLKKVERALGKLWKDAALNGDPERCLRRLQQDLLRLERGG